MLLLALVNANMVALVFVHANVAALTHANVV